jgi:C4-dicarboxylate-specific signal transduction histidine kinase
MALDRALQLHPVLLIPGFLGLLLLLDWATYVPSFAPLGITPWNPSIGLALGFVLVKGPAYLPLLALGTLLSDLLVRGLPLPLSSLLVEVAAVSVVYMFGLWLLWRSKPPFDPALGSMQDLQRLAVFATVSAAGVAAAYVGGLVWGGNLPADEFLASALRYWVGDTIGIMVVTPFMLLLVRSGRRPMLTREFVASLALVLVSVLVVFLPEHRLQTQLFYVLFLPIVWIALRSGLEAVSTALLVMQVAIMVVLHAGKQDAVNVTEVQAFLLVLVCAGLAIGVLIRERQRSEENVRLQQAAIAKAARLGSMDRLTTSIAHEINQPLTAIGNYSKAAVRALDQTPADIGSARDAAVKAAGQVARASAVIEHLRNLFILGRAELAPAPVSLLIEESIKLVRPELARASVRIETEIARGVPDVMVDLLQAEQLVTNLLRNAIEAMRDTPAPKRRIRVTASGHGPAEVEIRISDSGPGFPAGFRLATNVPNLTTKPEGLGIGLTLCHSIVEAHGGRMSISEAGVPGTVSFTLKAARAAVPSGGEVHASAN